jgi:hypothetical protein
MVGVSVGVVDSPLEAQIVCRMLATEGIASFPEPLRIGGAWGWLGSALRAP